MAGKEGVSALLDRDRDRDRSSPRRLFRAASSVAAPPEGRRRRVAGSAHLTRGKRARGSKPVSPEGRDRGVVGSARLHPPPPSPHALPIPACLSRPFCPFGGRFSAAPQTGNGAASPRTTCAPLARILRQCLFARLVSSRLIASFVGVDAVPLPPSVSRFAFAPPTRPSCPRRARLHPWVPPGRLPAPSSCRGRPAAP